jgi:hypothetical protein
VLVSVGSGTDVVERRDNCGGCGEPDDWSDGLRDGDGLDLTLLRAAGRAPSVIEREIDSS